MHKHINAGHIHGESGLDGTDLIPEPDSDLFYPEGSNAIEVMAKAILDSPEPVVLFVIGPMTNIALLTSVYPEVIPKIKMMPFMGGALYAGNITPVAEFNIMVSNVYTTYFYM